MIFFKKVIKVHRHNLPTWEFVWSDEHQGLIHTARKNTYKLFFEDPAKSYKPIWIGMLVNNGTAWVAWEKEIKAKCIELCGSKVFFD
jgi:hypothetical protein